MMQQTANDVGHVKRASFPNFIRSRSLHVLVGNQLRESLRRWLSPPDPSMKHNISCAAHHEGSAKWFLQGNMFNAWKSTGSLLWIHGKRAHLSRSSSQYHVTVCRVLQLALARAFSGL
jgi:hypothetical protein